MSDQEQCKECLSSVRREDGELEHRPCCPAIGGTPGMNLVHAALVIKQGGSVADLERALAGRGMRP